MINRPYWINRPTAGGQKRSIVWLAGVRRVGKPPWPKCGLMPFTLTATCPRQCAAPKPGFDTGFVAFVRGWRDKSGREVDFVVRRGRDIRAVECKIDPDRFNPESLIVFRGLYPQGRNYLVCPGVQESYERRFDSLVLRITGCRNLLRELGR